MSVINPKIIGDSPSTKIPFRNVCKADLVVASDADGPIKGRLGSPDWLSRIPARGRCSRCFSGWCSKGQVFPMFFRMMFQMILQAVFNMSQVFVLGTSTNFSQPDKRPVLHKTDDAMKAHLNLAVLAYWVVSTTKYRLKQKGINVR